MNTLMICCCQFGYDGLGMWVLTTHYDMPVRLQPLSFIHHFLQLNIHLALAGLNANSGPMAPGQ